MGSTFVLRMQDETGEQAAEIARAYTAVREIFQIRKLSAQAPSRTLAMFLKFCAQKIFGTKIFEKSEIFQSTLYLYT